MSLPGVNLSASIVDHHPVPHFLMLYTAQASSLIASVVQQAKSSRAAIASIRFFVNVFKIPFPFKGRALHEERSADIRFLNSSKHTFYFFPELVWLAWVETWSCFFSKKTFVFHLLKNSFVECTYNRNGISNRQTLFLSFLSFAFQSFSPSILSRIFFYLSVPFLFIIDLSLSVRGRVLEQRMKDVSLSRSVCPREVRGRLTWINWSPTCWRTSWCCSSCLHQGALHVRNVTVSRLQHAQDHFLFLFLLYSRLLHVVRADVLLYHYITLAFSRTAYPEYIVI